MIHWFNIEKKEMKLFRHISRKYDLGEESMTYQPIQASDGWMILFSDRLTMEHAEMVWLMVKDEEILDAKQFAA